MPTQSVINSSGVCSGERKSFAEFFAGIGLVRKALELSNWECSYANDIDTKKAEIYRHNFSSCEEFHEGDIWETEDVISKIPSSPFLVTASFPCVDLSLAGKYRGFEGKDSSTFFGFTKVLGQLKSKPKMVLLENVPGFITARGGADFVSAVESLASLGYFVDSFVLNAASFIPQSRLRVFIVGVHGSVDSQVVVKQRDQFSLEDKWELEIQKSAQLRPDSLKQIMRNTSLETGWIATPITWPANESPVLELCRIIDTDDAQDWWDDDQLDKHYKMLNEKHRLLIDEMIGSQPLFVGCAYRRKRAGSTRLEVRFDGIAGCLRTPRGGSAKQIIVAVVDGILKMRWMSAREYGRLQGAPDFNLVENERQMLFGFGDAVCIPVIEWIDQKVLTPIFESSNPA